MASFPMGFCPRCGVKRRGYALRNPRYQTCPKCGIGLIIEDGNYISTGFSPFTADEIDIKLRRDQTCKDKE